MLRHLDRRGGLQWTDDGQQQARRTGHACEEHMDAGTAPCLVQVQDGAHARGEVAAARHAHERPRRCRETLRERHELPRIAVGVFPLSTASSRARSVSRQRRRHATQTSG